MAATHIASLGYQVDTRPLKKGEKALDDITKAGKRTESSISGLSSTVGLLSTAIGALAASSVVNGVIKYSDTWNRVDNQLKIVITSESELIRKRQELLELSKSTNAQLDSTVALYAELYRNTRELNTSDEELMSVTATLNNLFVAGAKDAQTQAGAIRQLSQALGTGALRGDEFISVTEAAPRVMDALAQSLGIAKGELRDFAATGGITSEVLVDALSSYSKEAQALADRTTKTFDQFTQNATSNLTAYVGSSKSLLAATAALGSTLESVSENIDGVVNGIVTATTVTGAYALVMGGKAVSSAVAKVASNVALIKSEATLTATTLANTEAEVARLAISKQSHADAILRVKSESMRDTIRKQLTLTTIELTAAEGRLATAQTAASAAGARATTSAIALTGATTALGTAVNFLLGPWGLLLGAVAAAGIAYSLTDSKASDFNDTLDIQKGLLDDVTSKVKMLSDFQKADAALNAQFKLNDNLREQRELEQEILADSFNSGAIASLTIAKQEKLNKLKEDQARYEAVIKAAQEKPVKKKAKTGSFGDLFGGTDTVDLFALGQSKKYDQWIESIYTSVASRSELIEQEMGDIWDAMLGNDVDWDVGADRIAQLLDELDSLKPPSDGIGFDIIADNATKGLSAIQNLSEQGSKEYQKLGKAIQAVSAIQATATAIASATTGNIIGAVASGLTFLSMLGGGLGTDDWIKNQENQGLNIWGDKSESIANATDITANAVEKLVGINSDMLKALQTVQNGISKAAGLALRDTNIPQVNTGSLVNSNPLSFITDNSFENLFGSNFLTKALDFLTGNFIFKAIGKFLGGSSKVTDEGIRIIGGSLGEMMDDITVLAFQSIKYKKWKFGSTKHKTQYNDITDDVGAQFQLVLNSIADSVFLGATGLGLDSSTVEKAIQDFQIKSFNISLKGLSAEDQQKEVEAAFSKIFDDLAGDVIPFLDKFQQVGEGLGETLARVATQVSIMDLMVDQLGVTMFSKFSDPEAYAEAADNISTLVGGIEEFADKTSGFINNFATDATKIDIYQKSLTDSFNEVGLTLPGTAAGMWELMSSLDGSTEAGQEQIAMLLNSQEQAAAYFDLIEKTTKAYRDAIDSMYGVSDAVAQMSLDAALAAARMGDFSLAEQLSAGSLAPSESSFSTRAEYELARAQTAAKLEELAQLTEGTISVDEKQLTTLEQIRDAIEDSDTMGNKENAEQIKKMSEEIEKQSYISAATAKHSAKIASVLERIEGTGLLTYTDETA